MKMRLFGAMILIALLATACESCKPKVEEPESASTGSKLRSDDTLITLTAADTLHKYYDADRAWYGKEEVEIVALSDTASTRTTPDFTDLGVGMLIQKSVEESPSLISSCIIPRFYAFFASLTGIPPIPCTGSPIGSFDAPDPTSSVPISVQCSTGTFPSWRMSPTQIVRWTNTNPTVRNQFTSHLLAYESAIAAGYFPLYIDGLYYGSMYCMSYSEARLTVVMMGSTIVSWRIRMIPSM